MKPSGQLQIIEHLKRPDSLRRIPDPKKNQKFPRFLHNHPIIKFNHRAFQEKGNILFFSKTDIHARDILPAGRPDCHGKQLRLPSPQLQRKAPLLLLCADPDFHILIHAVPVNRSFVMMRPCCLVAGSDHNHRAVYLPGCL